MICLSLFPSFPNDHAGLFDVKRYDKSKIMLYNVPPYVVLLDIVDTSHISQIYLCVDCVTIQDVSRLEVITAAGDFLGLSDQKSSCKHVSDFGRSRSYGHFLIPIHALV